ncbi:MAG: Twin-arginine translocation pathway signal [Betaproteobacteria bacterium RBG_16_64_18]|nr:MAG: Twin-arginine translocation pathway signal [Betaproteobacteria bacterium RBG_16_64_18]OGA07518.1 MAG: Twin-arginine translocation pathway signal [Betaproteobacteria bacterium RIFCSPLOWO2_02_FULL_65_20]OGA42531.1 MAG: Twin-arginine translocation pathway signal [Betaproteobacteria bacterium RIFCSPLOWO2_12_FULL_65_110]
MLIRSIVTGLCLAAAANAFAQGYPSRPINMVIGFAPGGGTDTAARIIAKKLAEEMGQTVVVENKPGAGGNIATDYVAKSAPDGYTILLGSIGSLTVAPHIVAKLPYDPRRDLAPITMAVVFPNVLVVNPSLNVKTLAEYVKLAKEKPGSITYGSSGIGGAAHLAGALFGSMAKIDIVHVPYKGGGPAVKDLLGGQIPSAFATPASAGAFVKAGRLVAIAVTGAQRTAYLPEVPTIAELGYPGYEATNWYAYMAPAKTPEDILGRLHRDLVKVLGDKGIREQLSGHGLDPMPGTRAELAAYIEREYVTWGRVVKEAKITAN